MKAITIIKKNKLMILVTVIYCILFIVSPEKAMKSVNNSAYYLMEMLQILPVIFLLTVVIDALVPTDMILKGLGENSGFRGNLLSLLLGSISAGPIYAAFPISKMLLKKGASISNIIIILSAWAVIKVPMLANEAKFLGVKFMVIRWALTVFFILVMAHISALIVKKKDIPSMEEEASDDRLKIMTDYCIGCGLCAKTLPEFYEMRDKKAFIKKLPKREDRAEAITETVKNCPTKAIVYE